MKALLETINGKVILKVFYDPAACDWNEAIAAGLASYGLRQGQATVIAYPENGYEVSCPNVYYN
jgi:hypothetical protein